MRKFSNSVILLLLTLGLSCGVFISLAQNTSYSNNSFPGNYKATVNITPPKTIFGVFPLKADINTGLTAANNLGVNYIRERQLLSAWNSINNTYIDFWLSNSKKVILNINNDTTPSPFPKDLAAYENTLRSVIDVYGSKVELVVIENEELNRYDSSVKYANPLYHFGSMQDYINELTIAVNVCNEKGVPVTNGGLTTPIVSSLKHYYLVNNKPDSATWLSKQMGGISTDSSLWKRTDSLLAAYKKLPLSYVNLHWYEPMKSMTRMTGVLQTLCNYITQQTGKKAITNETGVKTSDSSFVTALMKQWDSTGAKYCIMFDGIGSNGALPLSSSTGALLNNGIAFRNYNFGAITSCPQPISIAPAGPVNLCQGDSISLTPTTGLGNYLWSNGATTQNISVSSSGNYSVTSDQGYCTAFSANTVIVSINPLPAKPTITSGSSTTGVCPNKSVNLTATASPIYLWNTGDTTKIISVNKAGSYQVTVTDVNGCKNTSDAAVVTYDVCNAPVHLQVTDITTSRATVNWDTTACAVGYQFQYRQVGTIIWTAVDIASGATSNRTIYYLIPGTTYEWQIRTNCKTSPDSVSSAYATGPQFTTVANPSCYAPTNLNVTDITTTKATLDWDTAANSTGYQIMYRQKQTTLWTTVLITGGATSQKTLSNLTPGITYEWTIRTNCKNTTDSVSTYATGPEFTTVANPPCNAPVNLNVSGITTTRATLNWDTVANAIGYQFMYRQKQTILWTIVSITNGGTSNKTIYYLIPGTTYEWAISTNCKNATDSVSIYAAGPEFTTVSNPPCNAPVNLKVTGITTTKATLNWDTAVNAVGYQFEYRQKQTTVWTIVAVSGGGSSYRSISNLIPGTTYEWAISTNCKNSSDSVSTYASGPDFTTLPKPTCNAPTNLKVTNITTARATLNWDTANYSLGYICQYRKKGTTLWTPASVTGGGTAKKTLYYLTPGTTYQWAISTNCKSVTDSASSAYAAGPDFTTLTTLEVAKAIGKTEENMYALDVKVYPNPATTTATVVVNNPGNELKIILTDLKGKLCWQSKKTTGKNITIPLNDLAGGLYILTVKNKECIKILRLIKE